MWSEPASQLILPIIQDSSESLVFLYLNIEDINSLNMIQILFPFVISFNRLDTVANIGSLLDSLDCEESFIF